MALHGLKRFIASVDICFLLGGLLDKCCRWTSSFCPNVPHNLTIFGWGRRASGGRDAGQTRGANARSGVNGTVGASGTEMKEMGHQVARTEEHGQ